jgi:hypothetical protein
LAIKIYVLGVLGALGALGALGVGKSELRQDSTYQVSAKIFNKIE